MNDYTNAPTHASDMTADLEQGDIQLSDVSPDSREQDRKIVDSLCKIDESDLKHLKPEEVQRLHTWGDDIQPHTNEGGDIHYIGDVYTGINKLIAAEWRLEQPGEYLRFVKSASQTDVQLEHLAHWMEVSTHPLKWRYLRNFPENREERAHRVKACVLDYSDQVLMRTERCENGNILKDSISFIPPNCRLRIIVAEDVSRDLIEALGIPLDLDPRLFRDYIDDYLWYRSEDPWVLSLNLLSQIPRRSHMTFTLLRARYYACESEFQEADRHCGKFNILRRLDSDRSRAALQGFPNPRTQAQTASVALARSKMAIWFRKDSDMSPVVAICLCDPTVVPGKPLWIGHNMATDVLRPSTQVREAQQMGEKSLFDEVVQIYGLLVPSEIEHISKRIQLVAEPALKIIIKEWLLVVRHMRSQVVLIEWQLQKPRFASDPADLIAVEKTLSPWRRTLGYYENWVRDVLEYISVRATNTKQTGAHFTESTSEATIAHLDGLEALIPDLERILRQLSEISQHIERVSAMTSSAISVEETRRSRKVLQQGANVRFLSMLATIFLPLNFTARFLSMSSEFSASQNTLWLFFAIGLPLMLIVNSWVCCLRIGKRG